MGGLCGIIMVVGKGLGVVVGVLCGRIIVVGNFFIGVLCSSRLGVLFVGVGEVVWLCWVFW